MRHPGVRMLPTQWHSLPVALRSKFWPGLVAALALLGLLLAFHQVVSGAVQKGELRRTLAATQADDASYRNAARGPRARRLPEESNNATGRARPGSAVSPMALKIAAP